MKVYLHASVLVALVTDDALTARADTFLRATRPEIIVSDLASAECSSALARRCRMGELSMQDTHSAFQMLDAWTSMHAERVALGAADLRRAEALVRRLDLHLRTPDALNIAIAERTGGTMATFDVKLAAAARSLGLPLAAA